MDGTVLTLVMDKNHTTTDINDKIFQQRKLVQQDKQQSNNNNNNNNNNNSDSDNDDICIKDIIPPLQTLQNANDNNTEQNAVGKLLYVHIYKHTYTYIYIHTYIHVCFFVFVL